MFAAVLEALPQFPTSVRLQLWAAGASGVSGTSGRNREAGGQ
jgi:hypothetical protein